MTAYQHLAKVRQDWIAAGRPDTNAKAIESPEFGTDSVTAVEVQAYAFQGGTSTDQIVDDGNGYRYFSLSVNPYMAAPVQIPTVLSSTSSSSRLATWPRATSSWASTTTEMQAQRACRLPR